MKIALFGYGKMGKLIAQLAILKGHSICSISSKQLPFSITKFIQADVCIDFSQPECILRNLQLCIQYSKPMVIGTTNWEHELNRAQNLVNASSIGCIYSHNFSIGISLFNQIIAYAAQKMAGFAQYDVTGIEYHHKYKTDCPSGTAKNLTKILQNEMPKKEAVSFSSIRCGSIPGTHTIHFDSPSDSITLTHTARNREGFAEGAIQAAEWIFDKRGFFTMQDLLRCQFSQVINGTKEPLC